MQNLIIVLLFVFVGIGFISIALLTSKLVKPDKPNDEKLAPYECGEEAEGGIWNKFNSRFYVVALIFILFEVEMIFLFPLATIFGHKYLLGITNGAWGYFALFEIGVFVFLLVLGLAFAWCNGYIDWIKPKPKTDDVQSDVPESLYKNINEKYQ